MRLRTKRASHDAWYTWSLPGLRLRTRGSRGARPRGQFPVAAAPRPGGELTSQPCRHPLLPGQGRAGQPRAWVSIPLCLILIERQGTRLGAASQAAGASRPGLSGMALAGSHDLLGRRGSEPRISLCTPPPTCSPLRSSGPPFLQPLLPPRALGGERDGSDTQPGPKAGTLPTHGSLPSFHTRFIHEGTRWGGDRRL